MEGPLSVQSGIHLAKGKKSRVQWVAGLETQVVDATAHKPISQEFFCHSNLTFAEHSGTPRQYNQRFGGKTHLDWRSRAQPNLQQGFLWRRGVRGQVRLLPLQPSLLHGDWFLRFLNEFLKPRVATQGIPKR
jgi:hypothetical protein